MRILSKVPLVRCYQVLHEAGCDGNGLTARALEARCNERYGLRSANYWGKQLQALANMGYAKKGGWFNGAPIWVALAPDDQQ